MNGITVKLNVNSGLTQFVCSVTISSENKKQFQEIGKQIRLRLQLNSAMKCMKCARESRSSEKGIGYFRFPAKECDRLGWMQFCGLPLHHPNSGNLRLCSVKAEGQLN